VTVLDHIISIFQKAAIYNRHDLARPSVVLWTDGDRLWEKVASIIAQVRPGFFQLDESGIGEFGGPSTWIRYQLGKWEGTPVVYLPGVYRHQFRGVAGFPEAARHLYALQFQGQFCGQINGKDWTPMAMLGSEDGGLGLDLSKDKATQQALQEQLAAVLQTPVEALQGRRLEASDFHDLAVADPVVMVLQWMGDPEVAKTSWSAEKKSALSAIGKKEFGLDPSKDGLLVAAEKLSAAEGKWGNVWTRFAEAPASWRGVVKALELVQPNDLFENSNLRIPATNRRQEDELRTALHDAGKLPAAQAQDQLIFLAKNNAGRADSVWADLGDAALAMATQHLGRMVASMQIGGSSSESLAESYLAKGWKVDAEARHAWAVLRRNEDMAAVSAALRAVYLPWLEDFASRLQAMSYPVRTPADALTLTPEPGTIILFVDGFRADLAKELVERLTDRRYAVQETPSWAPLPTVTATAKPGWKPVADSLNGTIPSEHFQPTLAGTEKLCSTTEFRKLLAGHGWPWIEPSNTGDPAATGWTEVGSFDSLGHSQGAKLASHIPAELDGVMERVEALFEAGWKTVRIVTDHGWLWMPGGLPKADLPKHLTVSKWGRCARPDPQASHKLPQVPWFWGNEHPIVLAPGVHVFKEGTEYTHGGLTLQEALTLSLTITPPINGSEEEKVTIKSSRWTGLKLQVQLSSTASDLRLDIRAKAADSTSSALTEIQKAKTPDYDGKIVIFVEDDSKTGLAAVLVVLRGTNIIAKKNITIGEE